MTSTTIAPTNISPPAQTHQTKGIPRPSQVDTPAHGAIGYGFIFSTWNNEFINVFELFN